METAFQTTPNSSTSVQSLSLSFRNLQLDDNGIWADNILSNNGVSVSSINHSSSNFGLGSPIMIPSNNIRQAHPFDPKIFVMATNELGSNCLQELLSSEEYCSRIADKIFNAVFGFLFQFMTDRFARHVFFKFITSCNYHQLQLIILELSSRSQHDLFLTASSNCYGASSIKKLIKLLSKSPLISHIVSALSELFERMMITKSGSSIILHCLQVLDNQQNDLIYQAAIHKYYTVSCYQYGCLSMNSFINEMSGPRRQQLLRLVGENSLALSKDPFANFVVQHVIKLEDPVLNGIICLALSGKFVDLSMTKSGSHTMEKMLEYGGVIEHVVNEIVNSSRILEVANDRYGNYVIQTALKETQRTNRLLHQRLVTKLQEKDFNSLKFGYGKNVYKFIKASSGFPTC